MESISAEQTTLYYVHDPMCSWCYAFRPLWQQIMAELPAEVRVTYLLGGLAPDSEQPMHAEMQQALIATWQRIMTVVPGTHFNFDFWTQQRPRRSTYPACRAVLAAKQLEPKSETKMIQGIQDAYYQQAKNPSDAATLIEVAERIGLDHKAFADCLLAPETHQALLTEIAYAHSIGGDSYPSLILKRAGENYEPLRLSYTDKHAILAQI